MHRIDKETNLQCRNAICLKIDFSEKPGFFFKYLIHPILLVLLFINNSSLMAQDKKVPYYQLDPVVITGSSIPDHLSRIGRSVSVISREKIELLPVDNISDLLKYVSGVDIRQRGMHGVQADVHIRGSTFEQTLILVDGITVNDPQTGHHNLDLPINLEDIERIEVLKGPGTRIYGQDAMSGVINIITRDVEEDVVGGHVRYGHYDFYKLYFHGSLKTANISNRASVSRCSSEGYIKNKTDFDINTLAYKSIFNRGKHIYRISLGFVDKDFGAYGFYSDVYPNEREQTDTFLAYTSAHLKFEDLDIMPKIFWRHHNDDFKIERQNNWYQNEHQTDTFGTLMNSRFTSKLGITVLGCEFTAETLESSNLGDHNRHRSGVFFEHKYYPAEWWTFGVGASAMKYSDRQWEFWPGAELSFELTDGFHWFASFGRSFRIPRYTELYYNVLADPNKEVDNQGNSNLRPEQAWTYETGFHWREKGFSTNLSLFLRDSKDLIDWSRPPGQKTWKARNISESTTQGFELGIEFYPYIFYSKTCISSANISYAYLDSDWDTGGFESKYVLDHLTHQIHGSILFTWSEDLKQTLKARYEKRMIGDSHVIVDMRIGYKCREYELFLEANNMFDEKYTESGFVPMPGFWMIGGMRFNMDF